jgi:NADH pyrophosphatase NudC (nudix superfamily)
MAKFCPECAHPISDNSLPFCAKCGAKLPTTSAEAQPSAIQSTVTSQSRISTQNEKDKFDRNSVIKVILLVFVGSLILFMVILPFAYNNFDLSFSSLTGYQVRVIYPGQWTGGYAVDNSALTYITGSGTRTYDVQTPTVIVAIAAKKEDTSSQRLTVQILKGGKVIKSDFTDAPKGTIASVYQI